MSRTDDKTRLLADQQEPFLERPEFEEGRELPREGAIEAETAFESKPWKYKLLALLCSCLLSIGSHFAAQMLGALKNTLREELDITNAQYGLLQSAVSLVNTITPFFGGIFIDVFGTGPGSILASSLILFGDVIVATSTHLESFPVMIVGRVIYGVGAGSIVTVQEAILAHWFKGKGLAITLGIQIAVSRLSSFLATGTVVPISEHLDFYGYAFWVSAAICFFSWIVNLVYVGMLWYLGENKSKDLLAIEKKLSKKSKFQLSAIYSFPTFFWLIAFMSFAFGGCWGPFLHISPDLLSTNFGHDDAAAGWDSSVNLVVPVVLSPFLGYAIDRWGKRSLITLIAAFLLIPAFSLLGFTMFEPLVSLVLFSFSYTLGPVALISCIPLILDVSVVGTALGIYKCASNIGATLVDPVIGAVQDYFEQYDEVMLILIGFAAVAALGSFAMVAVDYRQLHQLLSLTSVKRKVWVESKTFDDVAPKASRTMTIVYALITAILLVASWAVYIALVVVTQVNDDTP